METPYCGWLGERAGREKLGPGVQPDGSFVLGKETGVPEGLRCQEKTDGPERTYHCRAGQAGGGGGDIKLCSVVHRRSFLKQSRRASSGQLKVIIQ